MSLTLPYYSSLNSQMAEYYKQVKLQEYNDAYQQAQLNIVLEGERNLVSQAEIMNRLTQLQQEIANQATQTLIPLSKDLQASRKLSGVSPEAPVIEEQKFPGMTAAEYENKIRNKEKEKAKQKAKEKAKEKKERETMQAEDLATQYQNKYKKMVEKAVEKSKEKAKQKKEIAAMQSEDPKLKKLQKEIEKKALPIGTFEILVEKINKKRQKENLPLMKKNPREAPAKLQGNASPKRQPQGNGLKKRNAKGQFTK